MHKSRFLLPGIVLISGFLLSGCGDDPTNVGIGLVDQQAGAPEIVRLEAERFELSPDYDITGGSPFNSSSTGAVRVLAGRVEDPSLGVIDVVGNIDFVNDTFGDSFQSGTITLARLTLATDYVYGDTLSPIRLQLLDIDSDWTAAGARSDLSIPAGNPILEFSFLPATDSISVDLPQSWISANEGMLRSDNVAELFHGFQLRYLSGNAVAGFNYIGSSFRVAVPGDTVTFQMTEMLSTITRDALPTPSGYLLIQDGLKASATLNFSFMRDDLQQNSIHQAIIRVNEGTPDLITPTGFSRTRLDRLILIAVTGDDEVRLTVANGLYEDEGRISFENELLNIAMQNIVLEQGEFRRFEIVAPVDQNSLDIIFLARTGNTDGPRAVITVTPVN